jgi:glycosyltransferase involved in cell wall biosynthesis
LIQDATRDPPEGQFDIIIDDGSHALCDQLGALQLLASHLKPNGLYIIEDLQSMENANTILETSHDIKFELKDLRSVRGQYDDVLLIGRPTNSEPKLKVAIWGETIWAIGRIHRAIQKYLDCARVDMYDWSNGESNNRLFTTAWKDYDRIVTKSDIFKLEEMFGLKLPDGILSKLVVISHCPDLDHLYFKEHIEIRDGPVYTGVSKETCEALRKKGVRAPIWVPFGADTEIFKNTHVFSPNEIKRIGMICVQGHNSEYNSVKRPDMFEEICQRVGATPVYICNRLTEDATLYSDIDLLISCSEFEAGPLGIFEAASCGVPVLTRPVGNAKYIEGIRTFNTADEAVDIIKSWNETSLCVYRDAITHEVHTNWSMKKCIRDYFEAAIFHRDTNKVAVWGEKTGRLGGLEMPSKNMFQMRICTTGRIARTTPRYGFLENGKTIIPSYQIHLCSN